MRAISLLVALTLVTATSACSESGSSLIVAGRTGGPVPNEQCAWTLSSHGEIRGAVSLSSESADGSSKGTNVFPEGDDDVVWIQTRTFCDDSPTFVFGGVSADVGSLVLTSPQSEQVVLEVYDVPDGSHGAFIGELPRSWRSDRSFRVEAIARGDDVVLSEETYNH